MELDEYCKDIFNWMKFEQGQPLRVLDLGCGDCEFLFDFYHIFDFDYCRIDAIDSYEEGPTRHYELLEPGDLYERYTTPERVSPRKPLKRGVMFFTKMKAYDFLENTDKLYDVIILKEFLHCLKSKKEAKKHIQKSIKNLSDNGYLFISNATDQHTNINDPVRNPKWGSIEQDVKEWVKLSPIHNQGVEKMNLNYFLFKKVL